MSIFFPYTVKFRNTLFFPFHSGTENEMLKKMLTIISDFWSIRLLVSPSFNILVLLSELLTFLALYVSRLKVLSSNKEHMI